MALPVAAQMYTVREFTQTAKDLAESLEKIGKIGYKAVQMSAVKAMSGDEPEVSATEGRKMLNDNGLTCIATHRAWDALRNDTEKEIEFHKTLGCDFTALGGIPRDYAAEGADGYKRFMDDAAPMIAKLKTAGIRFGYHNHDAEFERVGAERKTLFDLFIDAGGPDLCLEIDVFWAVHAGVNPVRLFERCGGRVPVIHVKDKAVVPGYGPYMAPVGEGNLDWEGIIPACIAAGVEWYAVEQDDYLRDPFDCLRSSFAFLSKF